LLSRPVSLLKTKSAKSTHAWMEKLSEKHAEVYAKLRLNLVFLERKLSTRRLSERLQQISRFLQDQHPKISTC
jgi:hypothetical protein